MKKNKKVEIKMRSLNYYEIVKIVIWIIICIAVLNISKNSDIIAAIINGAEIEFVNENNYEN